MYAKTRIRYLYAYTQHPHTVVSAHFNQDDPRPLDDVEISIIHFISNPSKKSGTKSIRLQSEAKWQHMLHSIAPHGLNTLDENRF